MYIQQETMTIILEFMFWGGVLIAAPFMFELSKAITKYLLSKIAPKKKVVLCFDDGVIKRHCLIDLDDAEPIIDQIKKQLR